MKQLTIAMVLVVPLSSAYALGGSSPASNWNSSSSREKSEWVDEAVDAVRSKSTYKFTSSEIRVCLDSLLKPPIPSALSTSTLAFATSGCMATIKNR